MATFGIEVDNCGVEWSKSSIVVRGGLLKNTCMSTSAWIAETSFKVRIPWSEYERLCGQAAEQISTIPGLVWKAWVMSEARQEAGGVYLFENKEALDEFLGGPIVSYLENNPAFEDVQIKTFKVMERLSMMTRFSVPEPGSVAVA